MDNTLTIATDTELITGEDLYEMGDIGSCELIDGRIVKLAPAGGEHGYLELNLASELRAFVQQHQLGWVMVGEVGLFTRRDPDRVRGADIAFVSRSQTDVRPSRGFLTIAPELIVEIISPTDRWADMHEKLEEYFEIGVKSVWVVEPKQQAVRVYRSLTIMQLLQITDTLNGADSLLGFELEVAEIFVD